MNQPNWYKHDRKDVGWLFFFSAPLLIIVGLFILPVILLSALAEWLFNREWRKQ